jgi:putative membrane protein
MDVLQIFPHLNAGLNALGACFLLSGFYFIMRRRITEHRFCMLAASSVSALFLISYLAHHALRTYYFGLGPTKFTGVGLIRPIYFTILTSHTLLAACIAPFVVVTLRRALKGRFDAHRRLARLVYPIWLYVSITGVVVYLMLYQFYPAKPMP